MRHTWPASPGELAAIRATTREFVGALDLTEEARYDLVLAVNEAATNAVEHAYGSAAAGATVDVVFRTEPGALAIEVVDRGSWRTPPDEPGGRGFGLTLMQRVVQFVLIHHDARGTRVMLTHPVPGRACTLPADCRQPVSPRMASG